MADARAKTLLLVEDEAIIAMNQRDILERNGYAVLTARTGREAIDATSGDTHIDLILMDIDLGPGMDGTEAAGEILSNRNLPIVFLTSHAEKKMVERVKGITRYGYVLKHAGEFVLIEAITMAFELFSARCEAEARRARLETTLNSLQNAVVTTDTAGIVSEINPAAEVLTGVDKKSAVGRPIHEVVKLTGSGTCASIGRQLAHVLTGGRMVTSDEVVLESASDDRSFRVSTSASPLYSDGIEGAVFVFWDRTAELRAREALQEAKRRRQAAVRLSESQLRALFESTDDVMYLKDSERRFVQLNPAAERVFGRSADTVRGRRMEDFADFGTASHAEQIDLRVLSGESVEYEDCAVVDGAMRIFDVKVRPVSGDHGDVVGICGVARDITERLNQQLEYSHILRTALDGFLVFDESARILQANPAAASMLGYSEEELLALTISEIDVDEDAERVREHMAEVRAMGALRFETRHRRKDGVVVDVEVSISYLAGPPGRFIAFVRDIGEHKIALELLRHLGKSNDTHELLSDVTRLMKDWAGCDAVGVRLKDGDDYPYFETRGFPPEFVKAERSLLEVDGHGMIVRDQSARPFLECMCGRVLRGDTDPEEPYFTDAGSFFTRSTSELLSSTTEGERGTKTRNRCNREGYESVALVPIRHGSDTLGLLQFNDRRKGRFHRSMVELFERLATNLGLGLKQRKDAETLRRNREDLSALMENADGHVWSVDPDYRLIIANSRFHDAIRRGLGATYRSGDNVLALPALADVAEEWRGYYNRAVAGETFSVEVVWPFAAPAPVPIECRFNPIRRSDGGIHGVACIARDISERKRVEAELRASERLFSTSFHRNPLLMAIGSLEDGTYQQVNDTFLAVTGYSREECIGANSVELGIMRTEDRDRLRDAALRDGSIRGVELELRRKNGSLFWCRYFGEVLHADGDAKILSLAEDITEKHGIEQKLTDLLREKDYLMAELNHRVKNNLAMVSSLINLKSSSLGDSIDLSDVRNQLDAIRAAHEKLSLAHGTLDIKVRGYVTDILKTVFSSMPKTEVETTILVEDVELPAKTAMTLGLIINEAATNAVQHAFERGVAARFAVELRRDATGFVLSLANSGRPIPPDIDFDNPTSLGLRLIAALSKQLGGSVALERGELTAITLRFPAP